MRRLHAPSAPAAPGPLAKLALVAGGIVVVAVGLVLSVAAVVVAAVVGAAGVGWLAWKTRALRRAVRDQVAAQEARGGIRSPAVGRVFEGEAVSVPDERR